jgi:hypothetical protein
MKTKEITMQKLQVLRRPRLIERNESGKLVKEMRNKLKR